MSLRVPRIAQYDAGIVGHEAVEGARLIRTLVVLDPQPAFRAEGESVLDDIEVHAGSELRWTGQLRLRATRLLEAVRQRLAGDALILRPLTPMPIPDQHGVYSTELIALLRDRKRRKNVWNIALTGGYGSGKSSVLTAVRMSLRRRVVEISLSSLSDIGVQPDAAEEEVNNQIQKEIVKQLLYRERPSKVPGSRFRRISKLPFWRTVVISVLAGTVAGGVLWLTGWGAPLQLPPEREGERVWLLLGIGTAIAILTYLLQYLLHNRVRIDKLGTASTSVTLRTDGASGEESYFDKYLDEVVYFFEMTKRDIVIVEDLDRFENPAIYASLRALNTVLNTSRQLRRRPLHFIYAVRDSIFEDLATEFVTDELVPATDGTTSPRVQSSGPGVWQADLSLASPPTQRTKFFDLVIPIVPFITHRTSRDLLVKAMKKVDASVDAEVLSVVAKHITDMRLLLNIINEYRVFHARVLAPKKLEGLTPTGLFAMVAFKNTRLKDFELIRVGDSSLDRLYRVAREIIDAGLSDVSREIATLEEHSSPVAETQARAEQLGAELQALSERWLTRLGKSTRRIQFRIGDDFRATAEIVTPDFWASVIDGGTEIEVWGDSSDVFHIDGAGLRAELGASVPERWAAEEDTSWRKELQNARDQQRWLRSADFKQLTEPKWTLRHKESGIDFRKSFLTPLGDPLLINLIAQGHIDRNFHLYTSEFHGEVTSANAMNFLIQHTQAEAPSYRYELMQDEVTAVLREGGPEVFGSIGLFNLAIYNELLGTDNSRLDRNIKLLAWVRPAGVEFIDIYVAEGEYVGKLFHKLAPHWFGIFQYIANRPQDSLSEREALTLAAFEGADPDEEYPASDAVRDEIAAKYNKLRELTASENDPTRAIKMLQRLGVRLPSLKGLSPAATTAIIDARQYVITDENLRIALEDPDSIGLDTVFDASDVVFDHVIAHFDEYLSSIDGTTPPQYALQDINLLVDVMSAVERAEAGKSSEVLSRLPEGLRIDDLDGVPDNVMEVLAQGRRFDLTLHNVEIYIDARSIDQPLARFLSSEPAINANGAEPAEQEAMAAQLIDEKQLTVETRVLLANSLTRAPIAINKISTREPELIKSLVQKGLVADDPNTFAALDNAGEAQVAFIIGSTKASGYFNQLTPSAEVLKALLCDDSVDDEVKSQIANGLPATPQKATSEVLEALAAWSISTSTMLPPEAVQIIQSSSVSTASKAAILDLNAEALPAAEVLAHLQELSSPYPDLLQRSTRPVDLPLVPHIDNVLMILQSDNFGPVSSWDQVGEVTRVWMRHPPRES